MGFVVSSSTVSAEWPCTHPTLLGSSKGYPAIAMTKIYGKLFMFIMQHTINLVTYPL
jgi:hypothetical protein